MTTLPWFARTHRGSEQSRLLLACLALLLSSGPLSAQQGDLSLVPDGTVVIKQIEWGFDGKAVQRTFTPLSVLIQNNSPTAVSGTLTLSKHVQLNQRIDVEYVQDYFVSGFSSRWVQLTPYVIDDYESWVLAWGDERHQRTEIPTPRSGDRATVLIYDPSAVQISGGVLRRCDQAIFPTSVTGTDSLRAVVFDSPPDWQGARELAFLEWLRLGGRVYLLQDPDGRTPRFQGDLAVLNRPEDRFLVGAGLVRRLPLAADEVDYDTAQALILKDEPLSSPDAAQRAAAAAGSFGGRFGWDTDRQLFMDLQQSARFHRRWWLVYSVVVLYFLALYPGCYWLGRRSGDWRLFYAGFLGVCLLFSTGFATLGRIGSAERNRVRSVAVARQIDDGLFDVTQWSCLAAVGGDIYSVQHSGSGRLYSSCQEMEPVNGTVHLADGELVVDLPPASTRTLLHRARCEGPPLGITIRDLQVDERGLSRFVVSVADSIEPHSAYVWHRGQIYTLKRTDDAYAITDRGALGITFLNTYIDYWQTTTNPWTNEDVTPPDEELFHGLARIAIGNSFRLGSQVRPEDVHLPDDRVRVFFYAPAPQDFRVLGEDFPDQQGYVLYTIDLPTARQ